QPWHTAVSPRIRTNQPTSRHTAHVPKNPEVVPLFTPPRPHACGCLRLSDRVSRRIFSVRAPASPALTDSHALSAACVRTPVPMLARMPVWRASHPTACTHARQ
ncbi:hypothetical protein HAX54_008935, partial [Datura stramonium]|nr:hypothetical protein [Datura stramonium]